MSRNFGSGATPLRRSGLWVSAVVFGVVFGCISVMSVVADFATSAESGWHTLSLAGWAGLTVFAFAFVLALVAGVPRWWTWRAVRRAHPDAIVLMCRRTITTAAEMEAWTGRPGLSSGADEFFVLAVSASAPDGLDVYRIGRSLEGIELNANHEALGFALVRAEAYAGTYWGVRALKESGDESAAFTFIPLRPIGLGVLPRRAEDTAPIVVELAGRFQPRE
jgi:hypothetical protein